MTVERYLFAKVDLSLSPYQGVKLKKECTAPRIGAWFEEGLVNGIRTRNGYPVERRAHTRSRVGRVLPISPSPGGKQRNRKGGQTPDRFQPNKGADLEQRLTERVCALAFSGLHRLLPCWKPIGAFAHSQ